MSTAPQGHINRKAQKPADSSLKSAGFFKYSDSVKSGLQPEGSIRTESRLIGVIGSMVGMAGSQLKDIDRVLTDVK